LNGADPVEQILDDSHARQVNAERGTEALNRAQPLDG
jgi:hypothetical protein